MSSPSSPPPPSLFASPPRNGTTGPPPPTVLSSPPPPVLSPTSSPPPVAPSPSPPTSPPPPTTPASGSPPPPSSRSSPPPPATHATSPPPPNTPSTVKSAPPPPPSSESSSSSSNSTSTVVIAVATVAGVLTIIVLGFLLFCCCCRKKRRHHYPSDQHGHTAPSPPKDIHQAQHQQQHLPPGAHFDKMNPNHPRQGTPSYPSKNGPAMQSIGTNSSGGSNNSGSGIRPPPNVALGSSNSTFTLEQLQMATDGFSEANLLGQGGFGYVHRGMLLDGREVAVKSLKSGSGQGEREFQAEVEIISRVHHRHLVSLVGYCITGRQRMLVYEFVPNNTLEFHLHAKGRPALDWPTRLKIALGSAKGLAYLHEDCYPKIIHRDIKASNILLDFQFEAKVADFGLAKLNSDNDTHVSTRVMGTFGYLAPEYASSGKLTDKSDVFSFGVMLLELITGRRPVDTSPKCADDSLVDWVRPLLTRALEDGNYDTFVDARLQRNYRRDEMGRMIACAAACVRHSARRRPRMSQVVRALEGDVSLEALNEGVLPGQSSVYSLASSDNDSNQYQEDMRKFRKIALATSQEYGSSEYSHSGHGTTSEYGAALSASSSEGYNNHEMRKRIVKNNNGFSGSP